MSKRDAEAYAEGLRKKLRLLEHMSDWQLAADEVCLLLVSPIGHLISQATARDLLAGLECYRPGRMDQTCSVRIT